jgi:hypothetical protein
MSAYAPRRASVAMSWNVSGICGSTHGLERLRQTEFEPHRTPSLQSQERQQRLELRVLLAAEGASWVGRDDTYFGNGQVQDPCNV